VGSFFEKTESNFLVQQRRSDFKRILTLIFGRFFGRFYELVLRASFTVKRSPKCQFERAIARDILE
jgi:hypothetical protein